jgi:hypothetical protein
VPALKLKLVFARELVVFIALCSLPSVKSTSACGLKMALEREGMPVNMINPTYFWGEEGYKGYVAGYKEDALVNVSAAQLLHHITLGTNTQLQHLAMYRVKGSPTIVQ